MTEEIKVKAPRFDDYVFENAKLVKEIPRGRNSASPLREKVKSFLQSFELGETRRLETGKQTAVYMYQLKRYVDELFPRYYVIATREKKYIFVCYKKDLDKREGGGKNDTRNS